LAFVEDRELGRSRIELTAGLVDAAPSCSAAQRNQSKMEAHMQPRMKSPVWTLPGLRDAILTIGKTTDSCGLPRATLDLVHVRVGQINGCSVRVDMHSRALKKRGENDARLFALAAWRETPYYTDAERAALALAEAETRLADRADAVPDEVWKEAARHFSEAALGALVTAIALANLWNRLNVTTRQVTGDWIAQYV
jgi:AhpD family alkylhydroperoxidase